MNASFSFSKLGAVLIAFLYLSFSANNISAQIEDETIKVESSIVVLNATITDTKGAIVAGLKQNQFQIFEDGKEQKIEFFESEKTPFAAIILPEESSKIGRAHV